METPEFLKVLQHFPETSCEEAEAVLSLKETFPFSQVLHTLCARVSKDHEFANSKSELQLAAVYSADRAVLKEIMEASKMTEVIASTETVTPGAPDVANTVLEDLAKLHQLKQNFELLFAAGPTSSLAPLMTTVPALAIADGEAVHHLSKKERIVQLAKTLTTPLESTVVEVEPGFRGRRRRKDALDTFIDQIVVNKQELSPESEKHKEQIDMIDHFIKVQPSISAAKDKHSQNNDLTTIKTGEFGDHIVSETLVEILLKQGKKERAIEVLKKLIWKFPQKKTYFAAQIDELRK